MAAAAPARVSPPDLVTAEIQQNSPIEETTLTDPADLTDAADFRGKSSLEAVSLDLTREEEDEAPPRSWFIRGPGVGTYVLELMPEMGSVVQAVVVGETPTGSPQVSVRQYAKDIAWHRLMQVLRLLDLHS